MAPIAARAFGFLLQAIPRISRPFRECPFSWQGLARRPAFSTPLGMRLLSWHSLLREPLAFFFSAKEPTEAVGSTGAEPRHAAHARAFTGRIGSGPRNPPIHVLREEISLA
ncbi:MAG: hypothetical protein LBS49_06115 [Candidatus Accumulibacter sp.]|jgi:hypothetical protein|nr:hypothetical protein [Accumulibacter sp.]